MVFISFSFFLLGFPSHSLPHTVFGFFVGWIYLRFYQSKGDVRGDLNESFAFATFFPEILQPPIRLVSNMFYKILQTVGLCKGHRAPGEEGTGYVLGGGSVADIERRRSIAMKALDQRMALDKQMSQKPSAPSSSSSNHDHLKMSSEVAPDSPVLGEENV